jgi:hypothetical protein
MGSARYYAAAPTATTAATLKFTPAVIAGKRTCCGAGAGSGGYRSCTRRESKQNPVALRVGEDDSAHIRPLRDVDPPGAEAQQPLESSAVGAPSARRSKCRRHQKSAITRGWTASRAMAAMRLGMLGIINGSVSTTSGDSVEPLDQVDLDVVTVVLADGLTDGGSHGKFVGAVPQGHERSGEGVPVDGSRDLDQATGTENLC